MEILDFQTRLLELKISELILKKFGNEFTTVKGCYALWPEIRYRMQSGTIFEPSIMLGEPSSGPMCQVTYYFSIQVEKLQELSSAELLFNGWLPHYSVVSHWSYVQIYFNEHKILSLEWPDIPKFFDIIAIASKYIANKNQLKIIVSEHLGIILHYIELILRMPKESSDFCKNI
jgi:hypothetical protein